MSLPANALGLLRVLFPVERLGGLFHLLKLIVTRSILI
uniref:Uncharacterized protein n=1 Tax=Anguilla anguilla TaxID=7936 RepID=A0A0E9T6X2_ANGAN